MNEQLYIQQLQVFAQQNDWQFTKPDKWVQASSGTIFSGEREEAHGYQRVIGAIEWNNWQYFAITFDERQDESMLGKIDRSQYFSVLSIELARKVPHLYFDSSKVLGSQVKHYVGSFQRLSLEGDFDKYFTLYSPDGYQVDVLSFITPELMQVLIAAGDYDIELYQNRLLLYTTLQPIEKFSEMLADAGSVYKEIQEGIKTYRDQLLPVTEGRKTVSSAGSSLYIAGWKTVALIFIGSIVLGVIGIAWAFNNPSTENIIIIILCCLGAPAGLFVSLIMTYRNLAARSKARAAYMNQLKQR